MCLHMHLRKEIGGKDIRKDRSMKGGKEGREAGGKRGREEKRKEGVNEERDDSRREERIKNS